MRTTDLIGSGRSSRLHIKASDIQAHAWYHEMFAGTLCGRWTRVEQVVNDVPLDQLDHHHPPVCDSCLSKSRRFVR